MPMIPRVPNLTFVFITSNNYRLLETQRQKRPEENKRDAPKRDGWGIVPKRESEKKKL